MKEKINLLISIGLGAILGWILGFLRLPALENKFSFSLGFIACLTIILLGFLIVHVWNKTANSSTFKKKTVRSISTLSLILLGGFASSFLFFQQNKFFKIQKEQLNSKLAKQFELEASTRKSNSLILINNLLDKIQNELNSNPKRILSEETIERITTLNYSFEPYRYFKGEKFSKKKWSPERGQLLLSLTKMKIDSSSFNYLKLKNSFFGADLSNANLVGADLSHVDLREALLDHANLTGANLNQATLEKASLQKVNLSDATLNGINLKNAEMQWTEFQAAELIGAFLNGANMSLHFYQNNDGSNQNTIDLWHLDGSSNSVRWGHPGLHGSRLLVPIPHRYRRRADLGVGHLGPWIQLPQEMDSTPWRR